MIDYSELVKALRCETSNGGECWEKKCQYLVCGSYAYCNAKRIMADAAAAIEALLKENKELIEDRPEMVEADGHWEWRKPNGEVLMPLPEPPKEDA